MKVLLQANQVIERRGKWTYAALKRFVKPEDQECSEFSRFRKKAKDVPLYDMQKVLEAEKNPEFIEYKRK